MCKWGVLFTLLLAALMAYQRSQHTPQHSFVYRQGDVVRWLSDVDKRR